MSQLFQTLYAYESELWNKFEPCFEEKTMIFKHVGQKVKNIGSSKDAK